MNYELTVGKSGFLRTGIINAAGKRVSFNMNNALIPNNWNYIVMTYDGTKIKGYANGQLKGEMAQTGLIKATASILTLGGDGSRYRFSGILDELRIHTRAWNAEKILSEYQKAKTLMVLNIDETEIEETEKTKFLNFPNRIYPRDTTWLEMTDYHDNNWFNQVKIKHLYAKEYFLDNETSNLEAEEDLQTQDLQTKKLISSQLTYHFGDHLGSSSFTINELHQKILQISDYYAFGQKRTFENLDNSSLKNRKQFTGKEQDEGTNLYYFGARYYDSEIGRFVSVDPVVINLILVNKNLLQDPQSLNVYTYSRNNPIRLIDPTGNFWEEYSNKFSFGVYATDETIGNYERIALNMEKQGGLHFVSIDLSTYLSHRNKDIWWSKFNVCILCKNEKTIESLNVNTNNLTNEELIENRNKILKNGQAGFSFLGGINGSPLTKVGKLTVNAFKNSVKIAGEGTKAVLKDVKRLVATYGGDSVDWFKKSTKEFIDKAGKKYQIHYYHNEKLNLLKEGKIKYSDNSSIRLDW